MYSQRWHTEIDLTMEGDFDLRCLMKKSFRRLCDNPDKRLKVSESTLWEREGKEGMNADVRNLTVGFYF